MKIRELTPDEWQTYKALRLEALENDPQAFVTTHAEAMAKSEEDWKRRLVATTSPLTLKLFALLDGEAVGMMGLWQDAKKARLGNVDVFGVYVTPTHRGRGISKKLLLELIDRVKTESSIKKILLAVHHGQIPAERLYKSVGFIKYGENEAGDSDLMELKLV